MHGMYFNPAVPPAAEPENVKTDQKVMHNPIQTAAQPSVSALKESSVYSAACCLGFGDFGMLLCTSLPFSGLAKVCWLFDLLKLC